MIKKTFYTGVAACTLSMSSLLFAQEVAPKADLSPVGAAKQFKADVADGNLISLLDNVPATMQKDIEEVVHLFANNVDEEVYNKAIDTFGKVNGLFISKKDIIIELMAAQVLEENKAEFLEDAKDWDHFTTLATAVLGSGIEDKNALAELKLSEMVTKIQPQFKAVAVAVIKSAGEDFESFAKAEFEEVKLDGNMATIKVVGDAEAEPIELINVDDRWFMADRFYDYDQKLKEAKEQMTKLADVPKAQNAQILNLFKMIDGSVTTLSGCETKEDMMGQMQAMQGQYMPVVMGLMMMMMPQQPGAEPMPAPAE